MRKLYVFIILILSNAFHAQTWTWSTTAQVRDGQKRICRDAVNNLYLFSNNAYNNSFESDTVKKIDISGNLLTQILLPENMKLINLVTTADTGLVMGGVYYGTLSISSGTYSSGQGTDLWLAKYDNAGTLSWFRTFGSKDQDYFGDICASGSDLLITGAMGDTMVYMGQVFPKPKKQDLFVSRLDANGAILACKFAVSINTHIHPDSTMQYYYTKSWGSECEVDAAGNIYLLTQAIGENYFESDTIGQWGTYPYEPQFSTRLLKLDASLTPQFNRILTQGMYYWYPFDNLVVSVNGDCYLAYHYYYGQSGNDDQNATIFHLNPSGVLSHSYTLKPEQRSEISDLEIDPCGNLFFSGYWYYHWGMNSWFGAAAIGELNSQLQLNWILQDSSSSASPRAVSISKINANKYFINGYSMDTLTDNQGIFPNNVTYGYFAKIAEPENGGCVDDVGFPVQFFKATQPFSIYPNPGTGTFFLPGNNIYSDLKVYNSQGELVMHQRAVDHYFSLSGYAEGIYFVRATDTFGIQHSASLIITR